LNFPHTAVALGSLSLHRTMEPNTLSAYVSVSGDTNQFLEKNRAYEGAEKEDMVSSNEDEIIIGEMTAAITFFDAVAAKDLGDLEQVPDLSDRFNDQANFHVRVPALTKIITPYLKRLAPTMKNIQVRGFMFVEQVRAAPGFSEADVLSAGLSQLKMLTGASTDGIFWIHSEMGETDTRVALHRIMAEQYRFKQEHPDQNITTFPDIGPISGTIAGIIPSTGRWSAGDDWHPIRSSFEINSEWAEQFADEAL
jgi:hypothetical protein